jgi:hypothetical protein
MTFYLNINIYIIFNAFKFIKIFLAPYIRDKRINNTICLNIISERLIKLLVI